MPLGLLKLALHLRPTIVQDIDLWSCIRIRIVGEAGPVEAHQVRDTIAREAGLLVADEVPRPDGLHKHELSWELERLREQLARIADLLGVPVPRREGDVAADQGEKADAERED